MQPHPNPHPHPGQGRGYMKAPRHNTQATPESSGIKRLKNHDEKPAEKDGRTNGLL